jgi:hypothetical protein
MRPWIADLRHRRNRIGLIIVADALVALGPGLIWKAARSLDGKPAPWAIVVLGGVVAGLASASPATRAAICGASKIATPCGPQT